MGQIDFSKLARQPKYAVPAIILPFAIGIISIFMLDGGKEPEPSAAEVVVDLPDAVEEGELTKSELMEQRIREEDAGIQAYNDSLAAVERARRQDSILRASQVSTQNQRAAMSRVNSRTS